jgi:very-short-patch-repair endonuclease
MLDYSKVKKLYEEGHSVREIAKMLNTYPNKINRILKKSGVQLRSKEEAAKLAVESGRLKPPMLGKKRTAAEKEQIGAAQARRWAKIDGDTRESIKKAARERWNDLPAQERQERQRLAGQGLKRASVEGSKAEKFLYKFLTKGGYDVIMHKRDLIPGEKYEIDLYLPSDKIAIEIDGPQHFLPVFGEDRLRQTMKFDAVKNGALVGRGITVVRVKYLLRNCSAYTNMRICKMVEEAIKEYGGKPPQIVELEISDE